MHYTFKAHSGLIQSIAWTPDDTGFVSSALDSTIIMWRLNPKEGQNQLIWKFTVANTVFDCLRVFKTDGEKGEKSTFSVYATD